MKLYEYIKKDRGLATALAKKINVHAPDVSMWAAGTRPIPYKYGAPIEKATKGEVTRKDLFPDDWQDIWPELIEAA